MDPANITAAKPLETCQLVHLGLVDYVEAWEIQREVADQVADGRKPATLLLAEHHHVFTLGRRADSSDVLSDEATVARIGASVVGVDRGGQATYHGPGQLVGYPVLRLRRHFDGPLAYVRALECAIIAALAEFGIAAESDDRPTGVWAGNAKIAAIGVKVSRGVTTHGFALNVDPDLSFFDHIVPCGDPDAPVTSMVAELGRPVSTAEVAPVLADALARICGWRLVRGAE